MGYWTSALGACAPTPRPSLVQMPPQHFLTSCLVLRRCVHSAWGPGDPLRHPLCLITCEGAQWLHLCLTLCDPVDYPSRLLCPWGFSRQEYWSGLPCPPLRDLLDSGIEPGSPALQADSLPLSHRGSPRLITQPTISTVLSTPKSRAL